MDISLAIPFLVVLVLFLLNWLFDYKSKLLNLFPSYRRYRTTLLVISASFVFGLVWFIHLTALHPLPWSIVFSYHYLVYFHEEYN